MPCAVCGVANDAGRRFCRECGTRLTVACPGCGAENGPSDRFCGECGSLMAKSPLAGRAVPGAEQAIGAVTPRHSDTERRLVSVLFVDLVGYTSFSEGRDAEDVRAMLTRYFAAASDIVQRHGGTVEKFIGDAVMAVWGTPIAHEDDAERAVRSALEILDRVEALGSSLGTGLEARAGVHTGEAIAVLNAVDQGFVAGDMVNTAARLQSAAAPGAVLVGERTYRAVSRSIACDPVEPLMLKGKSEPVPAWLARRVISGRGAGGSNRAPAPEPAFVGRDEDLRLAKGLLHATSRDRRPRLLHIGGVAGIGKSRLVWELQKYVDGLTETFLWHQGRCPSYGEGVTFWALAEMVRTRASIADTDDPDTAGAQLAACLDRYVVDLDERRWIEPTLRHLIGLDGRSGDRDELFGAWRRFFERVAEHGTVLMVFEDLHWADLGLIDFVESLLEWSRTSPILVLTLARPELSDRRPNWGFGVRSASTLHLDPLADADVEALVTSYVHGLPRPDLGQLLTRAEGIPLYAVETVRMLADRGLLEKTTTGYQVVGDVGEGLDLPETLHSLVGARLDGLPDAERSLVRDAAVAGHSFTIDTLRAITGRDAAELTALLRVLVRKEVFDQDADPRSPGRGQYRFIQSVLREVAYSTLSRAARRTRHLACAQHLERLDDDALASVVASHYLEALRCDPGAADADQITEQARHWLTRGCDRAFSLGSPELGLSSAIEALSLASTPADRAPLHARAARGAAAAGGREAFWSHLLSSAADYRALNDAASEARVLSEGWRLDPTSDRGSELTARLIDVEARIADEHPVERILALSALATQANRGGQVEEALDYSERALVLAHSLDDKESLQAAENARSFALHTAGRHVEARLLMEAVVEIAHGTGSPLEEARALLNLGNTVSEDDPRAALEAVMEAAVLSGRAGVRALQGLALANASEMAVDLGEWDVADRALAEVATLSHGDSIDDDGAVMTAAMLTAYRGDPTSALAALDALESRRGQEWAGTNMLGTWFLRVRGLCRFLGGDAVGALDDASTSVEQDPAGVNAPTSLWVAVQAACAVGNVGTIRALIASTTGLRGHWTGLVRSTATSAEAGLLDQRDASARMSAALDSWLAAELPLDHAMATLCALNVLPAAAVPDGHVDRARAHLEGMRATSVLRLYDATLKAESPAP